MRPGDQVIVKLWTGEEIVGKLNREERRTSGEQVVVESGDGVFMLPKRVVVRTKKACPADVVSVTVRPGTIETNDTL